jgi:spore coat protein U-like protein
MGERIWWGRGRSCRWDGNVGMPFGLRSYPGGQDAAAGTYLDTIVVTVDY